MHEPRRRVCSPDRRCGWLVDAADAAELEVLALREPDAADETLDARERNAAPDPRIVRVVAVVAHHEHVTGRDHVVRLELASVAGIRLGFDDLAERLRGVVILAAEFTIRTARRRVAGGGEVAHRVITRLCSAGAAE